MKKPNMKKIVLDHVEDFFIISGLFTLISTTFWLNTVAGLYTLGSVLLGIGIYLTIPSARR